MAHFIEFQSESAVYKDEALTNKRLLWILYHVISIKHCLHVCWWYHLSTRPSYLPALRLAASCGQFSWSQLSWWPAAARQSSLYLVWGPDASMRNHRDNHEYYLDWSPPHCIQNNHHLIRVAEWQRCNAPTSQWGGRKKENLELKRDQFENSALYVISHHSLPNIIVEVACMLL